MDAIVKDREIRNAADVIGVGFERGADVLSASRAPALPSLLFREGRGISMILSRLIRRHSSSNAELPDAPRQAPGPRRTCFS